MIRIHAWFVLLAWAGTTVFSASPPVSPSWTVVAPGVWKATVGEPEDLSLLSAAAAAPATEALAKLPDTAFPLPTRDIEAQRVGAKTLVRFPLAAQEEIYGLGVDFQSLRRTGSVVELHVDHWNRRAPVAGHTHAPVPLYVSSRGFAVLFDSARYLKVTVGHGVRIDAKQKPPAVDRTTRTIRTPGAEPVNATWVSQPRSDAIEVMANAGGMNVYVFAGPTAMDAVRRYNLFCGGGALPPKWGLGFMSRVQTRYTAEESLAEVKAFREHGIPLDMLGLEPGWMDHAYPCSFAWDKTRFPDPAQFLRQLRDQGVRAHLWFNPYVGPEHTPLYARLRPFAGTHLVWNGMVPDYTIPAAREAFAEHLTNVVMRPAPDAFAGFKIDEVDGYDRYLWPETAVFPSGHDAEQLRQTYGLLLQQTVQQIFERQNRRTMGQVRGTNAGASRFPFVIYNDNYDFDEYITAVAASGFVGVLWSPEVRGSKDGNDMLRRVQAVCFSPLALYNGWASEEKLWTHAAVAPLIRDAIQLRLRLLPYFYNAFAQYHYSGTPVIRPMPLVTQAETAGGHEATKLDATANPYEAAALGREAKDQYLFGDSLLVAPIAAAQSSRKVLLPPGKWYDFYTGVYVGENQTIEVKPPLDRMPLFVADGALVPMLAGESRLHAPAAGEKVALEVRHYGTAPGRISLYDDDGETFDHERGVSSWTELTVAQGSGGAWTGSVKPGARPWSYSDVTWRFMTPR